VADRPAWLRALERGCCSRAAAREKGCQLCVPRFEALDRLAAVVEAAREQHDAAWCGCAVCTALYRLDALDWSEDE
jgi:hypothetical protein